MSDTKQMLNWHQITQIFLSQVPVRRQMGYFTTASLDGETWTVQNWYRQSDKSEPELQVTATYTIYGDRIS